MYKFTLFMVFISLNASTLNGQGNGGQSDYFKGFESSSQDNWSYTTNIPFYALNIGNSDLWSNYSEANGRIEKAFAGSSYLAGRDLDNPYTEAYTGEASPEHILTFDPISLGGLSAEFSFRLNYVNLDKFDYIYYELVYDNGTSWSSPDEHIDVFATTQGGQNSTIDWEEVRFDVPSGHPHVRLRLVIYQNGNEYLGFDNFELNLPTLSTSNNLIEGFTFSPNPTQGILKIKAKVILDKATIYDVLGKEVFSQYGGYKEMVLNITHLSKGVYFTKVESNGIIQTIKLIKK